MNYIVFDLEWNQSLEADESYNRRLPFEIIEIGAVKLGPKLELKGMFSQVIKPQVYTKLYGITRELLQIQEDELEKGVDFATAYADFLRFCGDDFIFCTWGEADIHELLNNVKFFDVKSPFDKPVLYYDLQKLYCRQNHLGKSRVKLQAVAQTLGIRMAEDFHRALSDAKYTAEVMRRLDMKKLRGDYSVDTFFVPKTREEEVLIKGEDYTRRLTRSFADRNELMGDSEVISLRCPVCNRNCKKLIPWFSGSGKSYYALGSCMKHDLVAGKIKTKSGQDDRIFAIKRIRRATREDALQIQNKKALHVQQAWKKRHPGQKHT